MKGLPLPLRGGVGGGGDTTPSPAPNPLPQEDGAIHEVRALLTDCVTLWGVDASAAACTDGVDITARDGTYLLQRAPPDMRPIRWLLRTPERQAANRPPRAAPSIVALLTALRNVLGAESGNRLRIGASAP